MKAGARKSLRLHARILIWMWLASISMYGGFVYLRMLPHLAQIPRGPENLEAGHSFQNRSLAEVQANADEIVHIVHTRFMQGQAHLVELGLARLTLFEVFCLPTMMYQTSMNFIWIIRADPDLHPSISSTVVKLLEGEPRFVLLGSNDNPEGFGRTPRPFSDFLKGALVLSGNRSLLQEAYEKSAAGAVLLETRLDADDGLHRDFVATVQAEARMHLANGDRGTEARRLWRVFCLRASFDWHPLDPYPAAPGVDAAAAVPAGYLVLLADEGTCATPGLTFGYGAGAGRASLGVGRLRHDELARRIAPCAAGEDGGAEGCLARLGSLAPGGAVRARTVTSAGMDRVLTGDEETDGTHALKAARRDAVARQSFQQQEMWDVVSATYSVSAQNAEFARTLIVGRARFIAAENLRGQCTPGHSCKNRTREILEKISHPVA